MPKRHNENPKKEMRPIYVEYVYMRRCYQNPSWDNTAHLDSKHVQALWDRWKARVRDNRKRPR